MNDREISLRSILFLVIGILLLLSLVICIYIFSTERDLVPVESTVEKVKEDYDGTGKNDVTVSYNIDGTYYTYNFYYKDNLEVGDTLTVYYHEKNVTSIQYAKTSKLIFVCPLIGILLCIYGIFEMFKLRDSNEDKLYDTKVIAVDGRTQQLKILTNGQIGIEYDELEEEKVEVPVKTIKKKNEIKEINENEEDLFEKSKKANIDENEIAKIVPNYYFVTKSTLKYNEMGKEAQEIDFKEIRKIVKTLNSTGNLIKVTVYADTINLVLTNVGKCNLDKVVELLHTRMLGVNVDFKEVEEYKEY